MQLKIANEYGYQWMLTGPNTFQVCGRTVAALPPGAYRCWLDCNGKPVYHSHELQVDELIDFPGSLADRILSEIDVFWQRGPQFARYGFLHRRGFLFYGKQGCGKSSLIHQIISRVVTSGHVAFFCQNPYQFIQCMERFREVEPERPMVCVFEDVDAIIESYGDSELLQWLDGNHQVNKAVNLASTNYPKKLDKRIIARPRRFDRVLRIESPDEHVRRAFFSRKMPELNEVEVGAWAAAAEGLPFAALAELIISVRCLGYDLDEAALHLRALDGNSPDSDFFSDEEQQAQAAGTNGEAE
jgi:ATPase family associated with various cellular activities (AAA)